MGCWLGVVGQKDLSTSLTCVVHQESSDFSRHFFLDSNGPA